VLIGVGDDAALVRTGSATLLTTDTMTEGIHFRTHWLTPRALGVRLFRVAVSDISAMGGTPKYLMLSLEAPGDYRVTDAHDLVSGVIDEASTAGAALVGGNVSYSERLSLTLTIVGEAGARTATRAGAKAGQPLYVTGTLGDAALGVEQLEGGKKKGRLVDAYRKPPLRGDVARALVKTGKVGAMIDVSDGLAQDLAHICRASGVCARVDVDSLPISKALRLAAREPVTYAQGGGDNYELLFTLNSPRAEPLAKRICHRAACPVTKIGVIEACRGHALVVDENGRELHGGYSHF
jgi:thiamine-monophosphate kinase